MPAQDVITLALRSTASIEHVVKAALALADEVGDLEASAWPNEELYGYAFADRAPEYRRLLPAPAYRVPYDPDIYVPIGSRTDTYAQGFWAPEHADFGKERLVILQSIPDLLKLRAADDEQIVLKMPVPPGYIVDSGGRPRDGYQTWTLKSLRPILSGVRARALQWAQDVAKRTPKASRSPSTAPRKKRANGNRVFIVHGHNHAVRDAIDLYLTKDLGVHTLVMQAGASGGRTLPEKLEEIAGETSFAIFILTADDVLLDTRTNETIRRARQNVILEIGYFWALLGRKTGIAFLVDGHADMDRPSDLNGVEHIPITADLGQTKLQLKNELQQAGIVK